MLIALIVSIISQVPAEAMPATEIIEHVQEYIERVHEDGGEARYLGATTVTLNYSEREPLTDRCRDEGPSPPEKFSVAEIAHRYACDKPRATATATAVAWIDDRGTVNVATSRELGAYETSLLHLIADDDRDEVVTDSWFAYSIAELVPLGEHDEPQFFSHIHVGPALAEPTLRVALQPLVDLNILSLPPPAGE